ncbi:MAG: tRNA pseudouridine(55) synthase TruB [Prolixibacteraceae bacterium]|nr:tRNA pseudouridine(55) synthase TruB [Prolixibacteraceae bacterium]MDD4755073.1 tRNA pseudouridine(55) synthase TruB [Prolixibacteraceae bacterium]
MTESKKKYDFLRGEVLLFDKYREWTSFDLVQRVRNTLCRNLGIKKMKVGHAGTLDPLASGLMILCTGKATKLIESFQDTKKEYIATLKLGATTPSYDLETEEENFKPYENLTREFIEETLHKFVGETDQVPPLYSAVKVKGERAFDYARRGENLNLSPRKVVIDKIDVKSTDLPFVTIKVICSKGTYIRSLARDIGTELGCGAYITELRRTKIGDYSVEEAMTIDIFLKNIKTFVTN